MVSASPCLRRATWSQIRFVVSPHHAGASALSEARIELFSLPHPLGFLFFASRGRGNPGPLPSIRSRDHIIHLQTPYTLRHPTPGLAVGRRRRHGLAPRVRNWRLFLALPNIRQAHVTSLTQSLVWMLFEDSDAHLLFSCCRCCGTWAASSCAAPPART